MVYLRFNVLPHAEGLELPVYKSEEASGFDLSAAVPENNPLVLTPGKRALVPTGLCFDIPTGYEIQIRPRSGLAIHNGVTCLNTPGTIDSDYTGEIQVILINLGEDAFVVKRGMRIAQAVFASVIQTRFLKVDTLKTTLRGTNGFGSTGV